MLNIWNSLTQKMDDETSAQSIPRGKRLFGTALYDGKIRQKFLCMESAPLTRVLIVLILCAWGTVMVLGKAPEIYGIQQKCSQCEACLNWRVRCGGIPPGDKQPWLVKKRKQKVVWSRLRKNLFQGVLKKVVSDVARIDHHSDQSRFQRVITVPLKPKTQRPDDSRFSCSRSMSRCTTV